MTNNIETQIAVNAFTGVFLLLAGIATFFMEENIVAASIIVLVAIFFLTRAFAQRRMISE